MFTLIDANAIYILNRIAMVLMAAASLLHLVQLFIYQINPKWFVTLTGTVAYAIAAFGIYRQAMYGYYITVSVPVIGVIMFILLVAFDIRKQIGYETINPYTKAAAVVEIPAILMCGLILAATLFGNKG